MVGRSMPSEVFNISVFAKTSALFEMYPIVAAAVTWGPTRSGHTVIFFIDNSATDEMINKGKSRLLLIMFFMRRLTWLGLMHNFHSQGEFISGVYNVAADALSCFDFCVSSNSIQKQIGWESRFLLFPRCQWISHTQGAGCQPGEFFVVKEYSQGVQDGLEVFL